MIDDILHHSEGGPERGILEKTGDRQKSGGLPPIGLQQRQSVERQRDDAADCGNQRIPAGIALGECIGNETTGDDAGAHRDSTGEADDDANRGVVEPKGTAEVRICEGVEAVCGKAPEGDAEHHVTDGRVGQQEPPDVRQDATRSLPSATENGGNEAGPRGGSRMKALIRSATPMPGSPTVTHAARQPQCCTT